MDIGERIKYNRDRNAMTQQELADCIYTSRANISYWETGIRIPKVNHLVRLCRAFDITPNNFLGWVE